jgi:hypothetical protein
MLTDFKDLHNPVSDPLRRRANLAPGASHNSTAPAPNYYDSPDWWQLRAALMKALQDFPEARDSVVRALRELHALQNPTPDKVSYE